MLAFFNFALRSMFWQMWFSVCYLYFLLLTSDRERWEVWGKPLLLLIPCTLFWNHNGKLSSKISWKCFQFSENTYTFYMRATKWSFKSVAFFTIAFRSQGHLWVIPKTALTHKRKQNLKIKTTNGKVSKMYLYPYI